MAFHILKELLEIDKILQSMLVDFMLPINAIYLTLCLLEQDSNKILGINWRSFEFKTSLLFFFFCQIITIGLDKALVTWTVPSHYLNQCWNIINWTLRNKLQ